MLIKSEPKLTKAERRVALLGSPLLFTSTFYELINGRPYSISEPVSREPHAITICKAFKKVFNLEEKHLIISIPPGHGKSTHLSYFIAWCYARYPDCNFIYVTHSADKASDVTFEAKLVLELPFYKELFPDSCISKAYSAKDDFKTIAGGRTKGFGSEGPITGCNAGYPHCNRFTGAILMDDMHKPKEVFSPTIRQGIVDNYSLTIKSRARGPNVPSLYIGHMLHEEDLPSFLKNGGDGNKWAQVILPAEDDHGNILDEGITTRAFLNNEKEKNAYVYWSQYQQKPQSPGGSIFQREFFVLRDSEPKMLATFLTCDTAETSKDYNDATVFSFWGIYKLTLNNIDMDMYGLHWIDCVELRVEPKDLEPEFWQFYTRCMRHDVKPQLVAIEKKSTGTTLISTLDTIPGLRIIPIERTRISGNKITRYNEMQKDFASKKVSLPAEGEHTETCIKHMLSLTRNGAHAHDDIADTAYDAWKITYLDKIVLCGTEARARHEETASNIMGGYQRANSLQSAMLGDIRR
jgi:predicted phage terminase large subunit-like protein